MTLLQTDFLPTKSEAFQALRFMMQNMGLQTGVVNAGDYKAIQHTPNNMTVDVPLGSAWVLGQGVTRQGIYHQVNDGTVNVGNFANSDPTNPRIDQVLLVVNDSSAIGSNDNPQFIIAQGTPTAGATLDNRTGAVVDATLTSTYHNWMRIADVLIPANSTSVVTANIRDRRPWARGAYWRTSITAGNYTLAVGAFAKIDTVRLERRVECSGVPLRFMVRGRIDTAGAAAQSFGLIAPFVDGVLSADAGTAGDMMAINNVAAAVQTSGSMFGWELLPPAGTHLLALAGRAISSAAVLYASTGIPLHVTIEEMVHQSADNT